MVLDVFNHGINNKSNVNKRLARKKEDSFFIMYKTGDKRKHIEDEMSRFEAEISAPPAAPLLVPSQVRQPVIASNTYSQVQQKLSTSAPPPPVNRHLMVPAFLPPQIQQTYEMPEKSLDPTPVVLTSAPKLYTNRATSSAPPPAIIDINAISFDVTNKLKKLKATSSEKSGPNPIAEEAIKAAKASSALQSFTHERRGDKKNKRTIRVAGGQVWEDHSLADWPDDDFRIFCGDLGNDVNDELLVRTFNKYPSFQKAKVLRDKRTGKSKGFGFISFKEPQDFIRAMKEMDGRYVGSRPIKLRKSNWKSRSLDAVKKKEQEKKALLQLFQK